MHVTHGENAFTRAALKQHYKSWVKWENVTTERPRAPNAESASGNEEEKDRERERDLKAQKAAAQINYENKIVSIN